LTVTPTRLVVGRADQLIFTAKVADGTPRKVELFLAPDAAADGTLVIPLVDTGDFSARDAAAGDGIYSNAFAQRACTAAGTLHYYALVTKADGTTQKLPMTVACVAQPPAAAVPAALTLGGGTLQKLEQQVAGGTATPMALAAAATEVKAAAGVDPASVYTTDKSVVWTDMNGLEFSVELQLPGQKAAPKPYASGHEPGYTSDWKQMLVTASGTRAASTAVAAAPAAAGERSCVVVAGAEGGGLQSAVPRALQCDGACTPTAHSQTEIVFQILLATYVVAPHITIILPACCQSSRSWGCRLVAIAMIGNLEPTDSSTVQCSAVHYCSKPC
jgi:hypothetical protein